MVSHFHLQTKAQGCISIEKTVNARVDFRNNQTLLILTVNKYLLSKIMSKSRATGVGFNNTEKPLVFFKYSNRYLHTNENV